MPPYYLRHYFNPDFDYHECQPRCELKGESRLYYLGYVQNVVNGQVLAELIDLGANPEFSDYDPRFVYSEPFLPHGPNCAPHPGNPNRIIATGNGYPFYYEGKITVKKLLNVRGNLDFHTGNILFGGDVAVHGAIHSGFSLKANNVLVKGQIEGGSVKAQGNVVCESGVHGSPDSVIRSDSNVHMRFCQNAQIRAKGNVIINGDSLHNKIYVGGVLVVKGRLWGGTVYANNTVYVNGSLGTRDGSPTSVFMGYDPFDNSTLDEFDDKLRQLRKLEQTYALRARKNANADGGNGNVLELIRRKQAICTARRDQLWSRFRADEGREQRCRLIVSGTVEPGLEISIGQASLSVEERFQNVEFRLLNDEIIISDAQLGK